MVRFVRPRFLLSTEFPACLFAAYAIARSREWSPGWHRRTVALAVLGIGWVAVHDIDLTVQMVRDGRYRAAEWIARNVAPGDTVAYYGAPGKLPRFPLATVLTPAPGQIIYDARRPLTSSPGFIVSIPQQPTEPVHEWSVPDSTYRRLLDGTAGYRLVAAIQTRALWPRPLLVASYVNAPVRIFARTDVAIRLREPPWIEIEDLYR